MRILATLLAIFLVLVVNELWWRKLKTHDEFSRKFVHITVGTFVAFWPFFLSWREIELLSLAFALVVLLSQKFKLFKAIHSVQRTTWGEMYFALAVGITAFATHNKWIYMAAALEMALADGLAAIVGQRLGQSNSYTVLGHSKSIAGTLTFFVTSVLILLVYSHYSGANLGPVFIIILSLLASAAENASVEGLDNLVVPLMVTLFLSLR